MLKFHDKLIRYGFVYCKQSPFTGEWEYGYGTYEIPHIDNTGFNVKRFIIDERGIYDTMYRLPHKQVKNFNDVEKYINYIKWLCDDNT